MDPPTKTDFETPIGRACDICHISMVGSSVSEVAKFIA